MSFSGNAQSEEALFTSFPVMTISDCRTSPFAGVGPSVITSMPREQAVERGGP